MGLPYSVHAVIVLLMAVTGFLLSILIVFSSPFTTGIWFVRTESAEMFTTFGVFGFCDQAGCTRRKAAYEAVGNAAANRAITGPMLLWTVVAALDFLGVLLAVAVVVAREVSVARSVASPLIYRVTMGAIVAISFTAWIITVVGWSIVLRSAQRLGGSGKLGPAIWMGLASTLASFIALALGVPKEAANRSVDDTSDATALAPETARVDTSATRPPRDGYWHYKHTRRIVEE